MIELGLGPAAAPGGLFEQMLGRELAARAAGGDMALKVRLAAEQAETVSDLPLDGDAGLGGLRRAGSGLRHGTAVEPDAGEDGGQSRKGNRAHVYPGTKALLA